ncbi:allantoinase AllB [Luteimicrobium xylanilyticum]|uniref:allantoinase n=1 Tax=Luteimicrobium xylanilyticum TaxID=1133546 RepID=A0A5P9QGK1_9MICO|nr:allantoinase AllB [Luteimicrobium xylanilyticum]QFU99575.1 Allantoinase [Luteimicrobium xylanilyticum]
MDVGTMGGLTGGHGGRPDLVLRGRAVLPEGERPAAVAVTGGTIVAVGPADARFDAVEDRTLCPDEVLIPGLVDTHVHVNEPGRTEWEGFATATAAAAAGGVTTIVDMPLNSIPPTVSPEALDVKRAAAAGAAAVDVGFWGGAIPSSLGSLRALHDAGVFGFKCFLAPSGVDEFPHLDRTQLDAALDELAEFDGLLIVHAEDPDELPHGYGGGRGYAGYLASRPDGAEVAAVEHVVEGVRRTGGRAHVLHVSSAEVLPVLRAAKADGLRVTAETCPHYLTFTDTDVPDGATRFKCAPPIRGSRNQDLLWEALDDGTIDLVVTDHSPSTVELKTAGGGDFAAAWGGIAGLQLGLAAVWTQAERRGVPLASVVGWMASATAGLVGLDDRGAIVPGRRADLAVLAPDAELVVDATRLEHRNPVTAYDGAQLRGVVRETWLAGAPARPGVGRGALLDRPTHVALTAT